MTLAACASQTPTPAPTLSAAEMAARILEPTGDVTSVHDPVMIKAGERYYLFSTGLGISIRCSDDMRSWDLCGRAFSTYPGWILQTIPDARELWAPDVVFNSGTYAASSFGSVVGLGGVMVAYFMMRLGLPYWVSIPLTLLLGLLIGMAHGLFVTKLKMHGFLITLVTLGLARGFILVLTGAFPITGLPREFSVIGQGYVANLIPIPLVICAGVAVLAFYLLRFTYIGRQIYAVGGNVEAARLSGVNVDARIILCSIISVMCASTVGMIQAARLSIGHPAAGEGYELLAIAACILGGVSLMGGEGSLLGILVGAALIGVMQNEMVMLNINPYWHKIVISLVLLVAITLDYARRRQRAG
jgi:ribose transport system permease protein